MKQKLSLKPLHNKKYWINPLLRISLICGVLLAINYLWSLYKTNDGSPCIQGSGRRGGLCVFHEIFTQYLAQPAASLIEGGSPYSTTTMILLAINVFIVASVIFYAIFSAVKLYYDRKV